MIEQNLEFVIKGVDFGNFVGELVTYSGDMESKNGAELPISVEDGGVGSCILETSSSELCQTLVTLLIVCDDSGEYIRLLGVDISTSVVSSCSFSESKAILENNEGILRSFSWFSSMVMNGVVVVSLLTDEDSVSGKTLVSGSDNLDSRAGGFPIALN